MPVAEMENRLYFCMDSHLTIIYGMILHPCLKIPSTLSFPTCAGLVSRKQLKQLIQWTITPQILQVYWINLTFKKLHLLGIPWAGMLPWHLRGFTQSASADLRWFPHRPLLTLQSAKKVVINLQQM